MSGTSLDGVDIALCQFTQHTTPDSIQNKWSYQIKFAKTYPYNEEWKNRLMFADRAGAYDLAKLHTEYGHYLGKLVKQFIAEQRIQFSIDFISSHGHTIFHQPENRITFQAGDGAAISAETGLTVICDFRSTDVALDGQGAPLVPIGDKFLFGEYTYCLNLGGFANISFDVADKRIAFDICPVNIILNKLSQLEGHSFDNKGQMAAAGNLNLELFNELNSLEYYKKSYPKSLSKEWLDKYFISVVIKYDIPTKDKLRTLIEHISYQISESLLPEPCSENRAPCTVLTTGGGVYNDFLVERLKSITHKKLIIPDKNTIEFKEALIFAFLGVLRMRNEVNCLSSVTGAKHDNIGGAVYYNF